MSALSMMCTADKNGCVDDYRTGNMGDYGPALSSKKIRSF